MHDVADVAPYFTELFALLAAAASRRDYERPELTHAVTRGALDARRAGVVRERVIAHLRSRTQDDTLADIGDWYRAVLTDRSVARAIEAYYSVPADTG